MSAEKELVDGVTKDPGTLRFVIDVLWGGVLTLGSTLGGFVLRKHNQEMKEIKEGLATAAQEISKVKTEMHNGFVKSDQFERNRREMRDGIIALHTKVESGMTGVHTKIDNNHREVMSALLNHFQGNNK